jgi:hypothetical protein
MKNHVHKAARINEGEWDDSGKDPSAVALGDESYRHV